MNEEQKQALIKVLEYLKDEKEDFDETEVELQPQHIYNSIAVLQIYLEDVGVVASNRGQKRRKK